MKIIKLGRVRITSTIFNNGFFIALFLLPYFKNDFFSVIPGLSILCNGLIAIEFFLLFPICLAEIKISKFTKIIICLEVWTFFIAPLIGGNTAPSYYFLFQCIGAITFFEIGFKRNYVKVLDVVTKMFMVFITINAIMLCLKIDYFKDASDVTIYLLGMRTLFSLYIIPAILFSLLRDKERGKTSFRTVLIFVCGAYSLLNQMVSTGIIEISIILCLLILLKNEKIARKINYIVVTFILIIFDFLLTIVGEKMNALSIITNIFGKDITFSGRTPIWIKVVSKLKNSPFVGYGRDTDVLIVNTQRNAHNQWLLTAMEGGYVAMALLVLATVMSAIQLYKRRNEKWYSIVAICTTAILVGTVTEIQTYIPFFYVVLLLPFIIPKEE